MIKRVILTVVAIIIAWGGNLMAAEYKPDPTAPRSSVPSIYKWDVSIVLKSDGEWESVYKDIERRLSAIGRFKGKLGDAKVLKECLDEYMGIRKLQDRTNAYSHFKNAEDETNTKYSAMAQKQQALMRMFTDKNRFIREEIMRMDEGKANALISDPILSDYKGMLTEMRRRKAYLLSPDAEQALISVGDFTWSEFSLNDMPSDHELTFKSLLHSIEFPKIKDEQGKEVELTMASYPKYRGSKDARVRKDAVDAFLGTLKKYQSVFAATLAGEYKRSWDFAKSHGFKSAIEAYVERDNFPAKTVESFIDSAHKNLKPLHRYVALRKKILGLKDLHIYDLYNPLVPSVSKEISYEDGIKDISMSVKPMGKEYMDVLTGALKPGSGWVDIFPNKGKDNGAFSYGIWGIHPFMLLNYMNELDDVETTAHEMGHSMHSYLNAKANNYINSGYIYLQAETQSTLSENLLSLYQLEKYKDNDDLRLNIIASLLDRVRTTIYRQMIFQEFEDRVYKYVERGTPITHELLNRTYIDLIKEYYGPNLLIGKDDEIEWAYIPHFYYKYYVYSYSMGLASAIAFAEKIHSGDVVVRDKYIKMLEDPLYKPAYDSMKDAGVDLAKPEVMAAVARYMNKLMDEMEKIVAKKK